MSFLFFVFISLGCEDKKKDDPVNGNINSNKVTTIKKVASKDDKPPNSFDSSQLTDWIKRCVVSLEKLVAANIKNQTAGVKVSEKSIAEIAAVVNANKSVGFNSTSLSESPDSKDPEQRTDREMMTDDEEEESRPDNNDRDDRGSQIGNSRFSRSRDADDARQPKVLPDPLFKYAEWQESEIGDEFTIKQFITQKNGQPKCYYIKNPRDGDRVFVVVCDVERRKGIFRKKSDQLLTTFNFEFQIKSCSVKSDAAVFIILSRTPIFSDIHFGNTVFAGDEIILKKLSPNKAPQKLKWEAEIGGSHNEILYCYVIVAVNEIQGGKTLYYKIFPIKFLTQYTEEFYRR